MSVGFDTTLEHGVGDELVRWIIHQIGVLLVVLLVVECLLVGLAHCPTKLRLAPKRFWRIYRLTGWVLILALEGRVSL